MRPIAPRIDGLPELTIAEDQHDYMPITAAIVEYSDGVHVRVCRWTFTPEEREQVAAGADLYFATNARIPLMPHSFTVGFP